MNRLKEHVTLELITILRPKICIISYFKSSFKVLGLSFNFLNVENGNILFYFLRNLLIDKKRYCHALHKLRGIVQGRCPRKHDSLISSLILDSFNTFSQGRTRAFVQGGTMLPRGGPKIFFLRAYARTLCPPKQKPSYAPD